MTRVNENISNTALFLMVAISACFISFAAQMTFVQAQPSSVPAKSIKGPIPLDSMNPLWEQAAFDEFPITKVNINEFSPSGYPTTVRIRSLTNGKEIGFLISWKETNTDLLSRQPINMVLTGEQYYGNREECPKGLCPETDTNPRPCPRKDAYCPQASVVLVAITDTNSIIPTSNAVVLKRPLEGGLRSGAVFPVSFSIWSTEGIQSHVLAESPWRYVRIPSEP
jgi:hypothetical protein